MAVLDRQLAGAHTADDVLERLVANLQDIVEAGTRTSSVLGHELFTLARRNEDIAAEFSAAARRAARPARRRCWQAKHDEGVLHLGAPADAVADVLFSLGDGMGLPDDRRARPRVGSGSVAAAMRAVRPLLAAGASA